MNGVKAAKAAGMRTAGITTAATAEVLQSAGADWTMQDFDGLPGDLLGLLFANG